MNDKKALWRRKLKAAKQHNFEICPLADLKPGMVMMDEAAFAYYRQAACSIHVETFPTAQYERLVRGGELYRHANPLVLSGVSHQRSHTPPTAANLRA